MFRDHFWRSPLRRHPHNQARCPVEVIHSFAIRRANRKVVVGPVRELHWVGSVSVKAPDIYAIRAAMKGQTHRQVLAAARGDRNHVGRRIASVATSARSGRIFAAFHGNPCPPRMLVNRNLRVCAVSILSPWNRRDGTHRKLGGRPWRKLGGRPWRRGMDEPASRPRAPL
jgi:hypothetical protein